MGWRDVNNNKINFAPLLEQFPNVYTSKKLLKYLLMLVGLNCWIIFYWSNAEKVLIRSIFLTDNHDKKGDLIKISLYINYPLTHCLPVGSSN